ADLDFCRRHGFFRMPIPRELGGEGRRKVDYYLLTTNAQRLADVAISLTIQANTSIGTTPVFLARDKDLPNAQKDLAPFVGDPAIQNEIRQGLKALLKRFKYPDPRRIDSAYRKLHKRLEETVLSRPVLRVLAHHFIDGWQDAGRAGLAFDVDGMRERLEFRPNGAYYHWSDNEKPSRIRSDEYDYETDDPRRLRYYEHGSRRVYFADIAQLRERDGKLWYDYWELTGAKMWITNARMA